MKKAIGIRAGDGVPAFLQKNKQREGPMETNGELEMNAANAMNFVPVLSVLLIGSRMRAWQMDLVDGVP